MATVYLGRVTGAAADATAPRVVALKVIKEEYCRHPEFVTMFLDEAKIISRLQHPNLVQVIELGTEGDRLFIAMELLLGQSLWDVWNACRMRGVRLRYDLAAWLGARVAEGLHHAHEMRDADGHPLMLVHRDVNQTNILVTYEGHVKVIDFGLAKAKGRAYKTAAGVVKGKIAYLAPEQVAGQGVDRRADIFALGTTLWELTVDRRLFRAKDDAETLQRIYAADIPDPTKLVEGYPPALWAILKRALARDRQERYASASEVAAALDQFARSEGRTVDAGALSSVMRELFFVEHEHDQKWLREASAADRPGPIATMHPAPLNSLPPVEVSGGPAAANVEVINVPGPAPVPREPPPSSRSWAKGAPPEGMFSPPASRPFGPDGSPLPFVKEQTKAPVPLPSSEPQAVPRPPRQGPSGAVVGAALVLALVAAAVAYTLAAHH
jgi:serine/threonine-protein kinase